MKFKKTLLAFCLIMCIFFCVSSVAAGDVNDTAIASENQDSVDANVATAEVDNEKIENDVISSSNVEILNAKDNGTFTALQEKINNADENATITLENDYTYDEGFGTDGITVSKSLTIDGNGHTLNGLSKSKIFLIKNDGLVILKNIEFRNGYKNDVYYGDGAAIHVWNGNISVFNCSFINNTAKCGGAIYCSDAEVVNCSFVNNSAETGGAIYHSVGIMGVDGCTFTSNGAYFYCGGAIFASADLYVGNSRFEDNTNEEYGGAIYFDSYEKYEERYYDIFGNLGDPITVVKYRNCSIVNSSFINNNNRAIYSTEWMRGTGAKMFYCTFVNNPHGAIRMSDAVNCTFINNSANFGSAIYEGNAVNCTFVNNNATVYGGAIYEGDAVNCIFLNNSANMGGAIYEGNAVNCSFVNNTAFAKYDEFYGGYYGGWGAALYNPVHVERCIFIDNVANSKSNAYSLPYNLEYYCLKNLSIVDCDFQGEDLIDTGILNWEDNKLILRLANDINSSVSIKILGKTFYPNPTYKFDFHQTDYGYYYAYFDIKGIEPGINEVNIFYESDSTENPIEITLPVYIGSQISLSSSDVEMYCGGLDKFTVTLKDGDAPISDESVDITVNGKTSTVKTDSKGQASIDLDLPVGEYDVTALYNKISTTSKVTVKSTLTVSNATGTYSNSKVSATFLNTYGNALASKQIIFKINGKDYTATTNTNGVATASVELGAGTYTVTAINPVNNEQKQFKLVIDKANSAIALASSQNNGVTTLTATLTPAAATGNVVFNVNGEDKSAAIKNSKATLTLSNLEPGDYAVTASYNGDKNLNASTASAVTFNIADVYPILTANPVTKTYGTSTKLVVNLVDSKGNAIANADVNVNISSKIVQITTDSSGQATMSINKAPGSYTAAITYADAQTTAKITVKKATTKITAKAKSFKKSIKTKKYTITLKTSKNKAISKAKVTLKVNGKTYKATTNTKGQATFKITKLTKKGKFTAVVKFAGNKYYNAKTVKPKITVK